MTSILRHFAGAVFALASTLQVASAQTVHGPEASYSYDTVRGWNIFALSLKSGVQGCRAIKQGTAGPLMIEKYGSEWNLIVSTRQTGMFTGGIVSVDGHVIDSQFGLRNGYGIKTLSSSTMAKLKSGSNVTVTVNGDGSRSWSLAGSTAAILKIQECVQTGGENPSGASNSSSSSAPSAPQPNEPLVANCSSITNGDYRCMVKNLNNEPGYVETVEITPVQGDQTKYFFKVRDGSLVADVWVAFGREKWRFVGVWNLSDDGVQRCAEPAPNQTPRVQQELGQDAWQICLF